MKTEVVLKLHASFEEQMQLDDETNGEDWLGRDLQELLGYAKWENFVKVIEKAKTACKSSGFDPADHFLDGRKMVALGSGAMREIDDIAAYRPKTSQTKSPLSTSNATNCERKHALPTNMSRTTRMYVNC